MIATKGYGSNLVATKGYGCTLGFVGKIKREVLRLTSYFKKIILVRSEL